MADDGANTEKQEQLSRGRGRGRSFFAIDRDLWPQLWTLETANRLNFVMSYLVLLSGTGADHQLTKWSAKAIEEHVGIGKPRGQRAIEELIDHGLVSRTERSTRLQPQYRLPALDREAEPIFLPVQLVTGLANETPILRRIRETGDALILRMLIDLYAMVELDATFGVPIANLRQNPAEEHPARKICEAGANAVWGMEYGSQQGAAGDWTRIHRTNDAGDPWALFWERVATLTKIGALIFEPWVFDGDALDAEPLFPVDPAAHYPVQNVDKVTALTRAAYDAAAELAGERTYLLDRAEGDILVPLPAHHRPPEVRGVAKLRVEADTPGRRRCYAQRLERVENYTEAFAILKLDVENGRFDKPLRVTRPTSRF